MTKFTEAVAANDLRAEVWKAALEEHHGNITRASEEFGFTKQRGSALTKIHRLTDEAKRLRAEAGQAATGRPKKAKPLVPAAAGSAGNPPIKEKKGSKTSTK